MKGASDLSALGEYCHTCFWQATRVAWFLKPTACAELPGCDISTAEALAEARQKGPFRTRCTGLIRDAVEIVQELPASG